MKKRGAMRKPHVPFSYEWGRRSGEERRGRSIAIAADIMEAIREGRVEDRRVRHRRVGEPDRRSWGTQLLDEKKDQ